jgi:RNA polymerase sigma factor (sigma-70 family)
MDSMEQLLERAIAGDEIAEQEIFGHLLVRFVLLAKRRVRDKEGAQDIAQDACLTIHEKYKAESFEVSFEAWAYGVLRMKIGNWLRKRKVRGACETLGDCPITQQRIEKCEVNQELKRQLLACLKKVLAANPRYARALNLVHHGYKSEEVCQKLQVTKGNFYVILSRGRSMLRACLGGGGL